MTQSRTQDRSAVVPGMPQVEERARLSRGGSSSAIYGMVARAISARGIEQGVLVDVGCGTGQLCRYLEQKFSRYIGVDAVGYVEMPPEIDFFCHDLDNGEIPLPSATGDVVVAVETIEHLENPRAFVRELVRLVRPAGWLLVTTPNQLSFLSLLTLILKRQFNAFQDSHYPAHLTALLEVDLRRIAGECGLQDVRIEYSRQGRIVLTPWHYPLFLARIFPRLCSDNLLLIGRKPGVHEPRSLGHAVARAALGEGRVPAHSASPCRTLSRHELDVPPSTLQVFHACAERSRWMAIYL